MYKREFTGVWIPKFIIEDEDLNWTQRGLYAEIASFEVCRKSNIALGERMGITDRQIRNHLKILIDKGYIVRLSFDGRIRKLAAATSLPNKSPSRVAEKFLSGGSRNSTIDNSIDNIPTVSALHAEKNAEEDSFSSGEKKERAKRVGREQFPAVVENSTLSLFYQVIKFYSLPVTNHNHVRKWAKELEQTHGVAIAMAYLQRLQERDLRRERTKNDFVPQLATAFDIYNKSVKVIDYFTRTKPALDPRSYL